jgi:UDP-N-acetylglucosamine diphosphorylase/glucosamine-1-phosphate N-acetyltransferase
VIVLYDDACARSFEPFASTRPLGEVRAGALLGRERWSMWFGQTVDAFIGARHLAHFAEFDAPPAATLPLPAGTWLVNARALPELDTPLDARAEVVRIGDAVAAVRLRTPVFDALADGSLSLDALVPDNAVAMQASGVWLTATWDIVKHLVTQLQHDVPALASRLSCTRLRRTDTSAATILGDGDVFLETGAVIEPFAVLDTTGGPILLRRGAQVQAFTRINGPCYVGRDSIVSTDRIAASSIGDVCRVHGELSTTVLIGHSNKGHDGFVGHSILGRWVNLGAGTITSNLKNTYGTVAMWCPGGLRDTGLQFAGTFFGDHVKTGIGMRLTTGCVLGAGANVMDAMPPKVVPPFSWGTRAPYDVFGAEKFLDIAARMMSRRQVTLDDAQRMHLATVMANAVSDARWPTR